MKPHILVRVGGSWPDKSCITSHAWLGFPVGLLSAPLSAVFFKTPLLVSKISLICLIFLSEIFQGTYIFVLKCFTCYHHG